MSGKKEKVDPEKLEKAILLYRGGFSVGEVVDISGISKSTIYRTLKERGISLRGGE